MITASLYDPFPFITFRSYKKQIEEAEEIAALNLAKYRQVQGNLQQSGERADLQEQALAKMKASSRAGSLAPMVRTININENKND